MSSRTPNFDIEGLTFDTIPARQVTFEGWREAQTLAYRALTASLDRGSHEIEWLLDMYQPERFAAEHAQPMLAVERGRLNENQLLLRPRITRAFAGDELVGYASHAKNTSGKSAPMRWFKMIAPGLNYETVREIMVDPEYQHRGLGHVLGFFAVEKVAPGNLVSGYVWAENSVMLALGKNVGMRETGRETEEEAAQKPPESQPFGPGSRPAPLVRLQGDPTTIKEKILALPGAYQAVKYARALGA